MVRADRYGLFFTIVICGSAALTLLMSVDYVREWGLPAGDFYSLVLLSTAGMVFLALANDLIVAVRGARDDVGRRLRADRPRCAATCARTRRR